MKSVTITTDGGCWPNPGRGSWCAILRHGSAVRELFGTAENATNNQMEMTAIISGLHALKEPCAVLVRTDSMVCVYAMEQHLGLRKVKKRKNPDLVESLRCEMERHRVSIEWVKGHAGDADNERADQICLTARAAGPSTAD